MSYKSVHLDLVRHVFLGHVRDYLDDPSWSDADWEQAFDTFIASVRRGGNGWAGSERREAASPDDGVQTGGSVPRE